MEKRRVEVDILTANYNNGKYIRQLIDSVIGSSVHPQQFIIIEDGSTDDSKDIISQYALQYDFIVPVFLFENRGFANALNEGIKQIKSRYVLRIDADDYLTSERILVQYEYMQNNPDADVLGSNIAYFNSDNGAKLFESHVNLTPAAIKKDFLKASCGTIHGSVICKADLFHELLYNQESVPAEDYELFASILKSGGTIHNIATVLTYVRIHPNSVSNFLPFSTIEKTFKIASRIWGKYYSPLTIRVRYFHLKYYRLFLFEEKAMKRTMYLMISVLCSPSKVLKRLLR